MEYVQQILLGLSLASAAGLRAFIPLLTLALASRFGLIHLNGQFAWLHSTASLVVLSVAALAELLADKIPVLDHALDALQTVVRPAAGALAMAGSQSDLSPMNAAILGLVVGAPLAGSLHVAKGGTRLASTGLTAGLANPFLSLIEDGTSLLLSVLGIFVPVLGFLLALLVFYFGWRVWRAVQKRKAVG